MMTLHYAPRPSSASISQKQLPLLAHSLLPAWPRWQLLDQLLTQCEQHAHSSGAPNLNLLSLVQRLLKASTLPRCRVSIHSGEKASEQQLIAVFLGRAQTVLESPAAYAEDVRGASEQLLSAYCQVLVDSSLDAKKAMTELDLALKYRLADFVECFMRFRVKQLLNRSRKARQALLMSQTGNRSQLVIPRSA